MSKIILTVDIVATTKEGQIILIERNKPPFQDRLVLPGGHVEYVDLSVAHACVREALEEINLRIEVSRLKHLMILDGLNRDTRLGRRISVVFKADITQREVFELTPQSDAKNIVVRDIVSIQKDEIGFDHWQVIKKLRSL